MTGAGHARRVSGSGRDARAAVLRRLLGEDDVDRVRAARGAVQAGLLAEGPLRMVVTTCGPGGARLAGRLPAVQAHVADVDGRHVLLLAAPSPWVCDRRLVVDRITELIGPADEMVVGVGTIRGSLDHAVRSFRQAASAVIAACAEPALRPVACWEGLGAYRALLALPQPVDPAVLHAGVANLATEDSGHVLLTTVETYLDQGGRVGRTATLLHVERGTVYYRLNRFAEMAGCNLAAGHDRLAVHLALKALRLNDQTSGSP